MKLTKLKNRELHWTSPVWFQVRSHIRTLLLDPIHEAFRSQVIFQYRYQFSQQFQNQDSFFIRDQVNETNRYNKRS